ncbi:MAG: hypothetical protein G01um101416_498 [Microgenomates group bacterium Gr01-1014_16]|nr:MAG: hypothetical protein G01um101416_498 [Microgenomates group bacterium Gr01-1014_16]
MAKSNESTEGVGLVLMYSTIPFGSILHANINNEITCEVFKELKLDPVDHLHSSQEKKLYLVAELIRVLAAGYLGFVNQDWLLSGSVYWSMGIGLNYVVRKVVTTRGQYRG